MFSKFGKTSAGVKPSSLVAKAAIGISAAAALATNASAINVDFGTTEGDLTTIGGAIIGIILVIWVVRRVLSLLGK